MAWRNLAMPVQPPLRLMMAVVPHTPGYFFKTVWKKTTDIEINIFIMWKEYA